MYKKSRVSSQNQAISTHQFGAGIESEPAYTFSQIKERTYAKTGAIDKTFQAKFTSQLHDKKLSDITEDLHGLFDDILDTVRQDSDANSLARVIIEHNGLTDPIVVSLRELNKMDSSIVMDEISKVLQSNEELPVDDSCTITVGRIDIPSGGGRLRITKLTGENNSLMRKRSIVNIPSTTMCMPMAIVVCFLKTCRLVSPVEWRLLTEGDSSSMPDKVLKHKCHPHWYYKHVVEKGRKECTLFSRRLCELVGVSTENRVISMK
ncbi:unnamed protein product [Mytilus edulis]|uniref:Uncharacterized protein n=1 Tax=Mytilus edulis TaxID=6550 RepID=A0A8S3V9S5_MYTED|nr:unnamed protein product [Mytilus edulis]